MATSLRGLLARWRALAGETYVPPKLWLLVLGLMLAKSLLALSTLHSPVLALVSVGVGGAALALPASLALALRGRLQLLYLLTLDAAASLLFLAEALYARAFGRFLSIQLVSFGSAVDDVSSSLISLLEWYDVLYVVDLPVLAYLALRPMARQLAPRRGTLAVVSAISLVVVGTVVVRSDTPAFAADAATTPIRASLLGTHLIEVTRLLESQGQLSDSEQSELDDWLRENQRFQSAAPDFESLSGSLVGHNVLVVQWESLESVLVGRRHFGVEVTPNLNRILESSIHTTNMLEQVRDGNSADAELLFHTSLFPIDRGSAFLRYPQTHYHSLPSMLRDRGYATWAIHGDDPAFWNRDVVYPNLGYDRYIGEDEFGTGKPVGLGRPDEALFEQTLAALGEIPRPFWVHATTLTSHHPFSIPAEYERLEFETPPEANTARYLQSIAYTDWAFGAFYSELQEQGLLENTVLVIFGDHEGGSRYPGNLSPNNGRVPFIIHTEGMTQLTLSKIAGQVDMAPTLAWLLGIETEDWAPYMMGRNLFGPHSGSGVHSDGRVEQTATDQEHLSRAYEMSDRLLRSGYFPPR